MSTSPARAASVWRHRGGELDLSRPCIMGVINVTPDSFSDGGNFVVPEAALWHAERLLKEGADILDIGGESSRPRATNLPVEEEIVRVIPVVRGAVALGATVSIDTSKVAVARAAMEAGATIINDITALSDPKMLVLASQAEAGLVLMHMQGTPETMQENPTYADVVVEVRDFLAERKERAVNFGIDTHRIVLDPGIGFGKTTEHNLKLINGLGAIASLDSPVLLGASRKRFIGEISGIDEPSARVAGSVGAALAGRQAGASIFRVHDVAATREALTVFDRIQGRS